MVRIIISPTRINEQSLVVRWKHAFNFLRAQLLRQVRKTAGTTEGNLKKNYRDLDSSHTCRCHEKIP